MNEAMHSRLGGSVVWPNAPTSESSDRAAEDHATPTRFLHCRHTQLREQIGRSGIRPPCLLEVFNTDLVYGLGKVNSVTTLTSTLGDVPGRQTCLN